MKNFTSTLVALLFALSLSTSTLAHTPPKLLKRSCVSAALTAVPSQTSVIQVEAAGKGLVLEAVHFPVSMANLFTVDVLSSSPIDSGFVVNTSTYANGAISAVVSKGYDTTAAVSPPGSLIIVDLPSNVDVPDLYVESGSFVVVRPITSNAAIALSLCWRELGH